jgi:hypothetical protein
VTLAPLCASRLPGTTEPIATPEHRRKMICRDDAEVVCVCVVIASADAAMGRLPDQAKP